MMSRADLERATWLLGPWLIGGFFDVFLQGILYCQFTRYATRYPQDRPGLKIVVLVLAVLTTLKSIHSFAVAWIQFIDYFTDLDAAIALSYTAWWQTASPLFTATLVLYVQIFFVRRVYIISDRNWWVAAPIATVLTFAYVAICVATYFVTLGPIASPLSSPWFAAHFGSLVAGDVCMTGAMIYFLVMTRKEVLPQTAGLYTALIQLTWLSTAPATVCAILNLTLSQAWSGVERLLSVTPSMVLPKLYAISMMWTLNERLDLRNAITTVDIALSYRRGPGSRTTEVSGGAIQVEVCRQSDAQYDTSNQGTDTGKPAYFIREEV